MCTICTEICVSTPGGMDFLAFALTAVQSHSAGVSSCFSPARAGEVTLDVLLIFLMGQDL